MSDDNVTPITPSHVCASCKATIDTRDVYEGHGPTCMQPEVRIRRLERQVVELKDAHNHLVDVAANLVEWKRRQVEQINSDVIALLRVTGERLDALEGRAKKETHGISEASPDTQRSGSPVTHCPCGDQFRPGHPTGWCEPFRGAAELIAAHPRCAHADASAAEPERSPDAGPDAAGEEPGRA